MTTKKKRPEASISRRARDLITRIPLFPDPRTVWAKVPPIHLPFKGTIGFFIFDNMWELDFAGPWNVLAVAVGKYGGKVVSIARDDKTIKAAHGCRILPDYTFANAPRLDILVVPGGVVPLDAPVVAWVSKVGAKCKWVTSVCTGALLLYEAGFLAGKKATTWAGTIAYLGSLTHQGKVTVLDDVRYVRDGNVVTSAGVSAGIDMALWLVGAIYSSTYARDVQKGIEYYPVPPYQGEV